jgi:hypothetical protein
MWRRRRWGFDGAATAVRRLPEDPTQSKKKEVITMTDKKQQKTIPCGCGCGCPTSPKKETESVAVKKEEKKTKK